MRDELQKLDLDRKIDVVYDAVGGRFTEPAFRAMGWGGRLLVVGFAAGGQVPHDAIPRLPLNLALINERQVLGVFWGPWCARDNNRCGDNQPPRLKTAVSPNPSPKNLMSPRHDHFWLV